MLPPRRFVAQEIFTVPLSRLWDFLCAHDPLRPDFRGTRLDYSASVSDDGRPTYHVKAKWGGVPVPGWTEYPYEWRREQGFACLRESPQGPLVRDWGGFELEAAGSGTRVRAFLELTPRSWWWLPFVRLLGRWRVQRALARCRRFQDQVEQGEGVLDEDRFSLFRPLWRHRLKEFEPGSSLSTRLVGRLKHHLASAPDSEVLHMRPFELAREWEAERGDMARLFLHAAREGMLNLHWELKCPSCRATTAVFDSLARVPRTHECKLCNIEFRSHFAKTLEVVFAVGKHLRRARESAKVPRGSLLSHHILAQNEIAAGGRRTISLVLPNDSLRFRVLRHGEVCRLKASPEAAPRIDAALRYSEHGWQPSAVFFRPGPMRFEIINETSHSLVVALERATVPDSVMTGADAICAADFAKLFPDELPLPGIPLEGGAFAFLSLAMHEGDTLCDRLGDEEAFLRLQRWGDFLRAHVESERGTILRFEGHRCLAVFPRPGEALDAAMEVHRGMSALNRGVPPGTELGTHSALHYGPALVGQVQKRLTFFGGSLQTVETALRQSTGGDIVITDETLALPEIEKRLERGLWRATELTAEHLVLYRLRPAGDDANLPLVDTLQKSA